MHLARSRVTLPYDSRYRRRIRLVTDSGESFLLDLPEATVMRDGDGLGLQTGEWILVRAAPEVLIEIRCQDNMELTRVAWHLGNRHVPTQIAGGKLRVRDDPVVRELVCGLGASIEALEAPFDPEGGAYDTDLNDNER
jgi:urease accessory protein